MKKLIGLLFVLVVIVGAIGLVSAEEDRANICHTPRTNDDGGYCYQYAVKVLCTANIPGTNQTSSAVLPGIYLTGVNIHNPSIKESKYRVKLVLEEPFEFAERALAPNHGTRWDCTYMTEIFGPFIHGFEGFLVIESNNSLDVTAVYTAGKVGGEVESIGVEQIRERYLDVRRQN